MKKKKNLKAGPEIISKTNKSIPTEGKGPEKSTETDPTKATPNSKEEVKSGSKKRSLPSRLSFSIEQ